MANQSLVLTALPELPLVRPGDDLAALIAAGLQRAGLQLQAGDVLVVAQKVVSKAEGRYIALESVTPSARAVELGAMVEKDARLVELILGESRAVLRQRAGALVVEHRLGFVCANAGIDHSNVEQHEGGGQVLLLPADPDASCAALRARLGALCGVEPGVIINDSHGRAWRSGTVGVALGVAGVPALMDLRGWPDLYGERLQITQVGLADELAAAASIIMGQAGEGLPVVHLRGVPYGSRDGTARELIRPIDQDLFR